MYWKFLIKMQLRKICLINIAPKGSSEAGLFLCEQFLRHQRQAVLYHLQHNLTWVTY